jgi:hypothetical protein
VQAVHAVLAYATAIGVGVALAWTGILAVTARSGGHAYNRMKAALVGLIFLASLAGASVFVSGARPPDGLHFLYGGVAIVLIPLARSFLGGAGRRDSIVMLLAIVALGGVLFRLFVTG